MACRVGLSGPEGVEETRASDHRLDRAPRCRRRRSGVPGHGSRRVATGSQRAAEGPQAAAGGGPSTNGAAPVPLAGLPNYTRRSARPKPGEDLRPGHSRARRSRPSATSAGSPHSRPDDGPTQVPDQFRPGRGTGCPARTSAGFRGSPVRLSSLGDPAQRPPDGHRHHRSSRWTAGCEACSGSTSVARGGGTPVGHPSRRPRAQLSFGFGGTRVWEAELNRSRHPGRASTADRRR